MKTAFPPPGLRNFTCVFILHEIQYLVSYTPAQQKRRSSHNSGNHESPSTQADPEVGASIQEELHRQQHNIELIASETLVSPAVMLAMGTCLTNKYAEGYPATGITAAATPWT